MKSPWITAAAFEPTGARMPMGLSRPLVEGGMVEITLEFQHAGKVTSPFTIAPKGAKSMDHTGHGS